ncbi:MAG: AsmA family protein [Cyclobacteriaceae bacterium]|nr:AsmA family protein [Cyclobacteriaceae bacterium]
MKKALIILASVVFLVLILLFTLPYFFKDDIKAAIDKELASSVNADINFELENFSVSLFPNFPNLTVGIEDLSVIGRDDFAGKVLFSTTNLEVEVNLKKILFDGETSIQGLLLENPHIWIKVLANGKANYDIAISSEEEVEETEEVADESEPLTFSIEHWQIINGDVTYDDETIPFVLEITALNHTGSGDFSLTVFDMDTQSEATLATVSYDGVEYIKNRHLVADAVLSMDLEQYKFTFKDNEFKLNDFTIGMNGWFSMPEEGYDMDLAITSKDNSFKSILSLIPAMYATDFEGLKASGTVDFNTSLKGMYTDEKMPAFNVHLGINDGMFQYPDLPTAVSNVQMKLDIDNADGNIDNTKVDLSKFHMELGKNPIDAMLKVGNLIDYPVETSISARLNFAELLQMFPMEGTELKGQLDANLQAKGVYDTVNYTIPASGAINLTSFYYADQEYLPQGMEIPKAVTTFTPENIVLETFDMKIASSDLSATGKLSNYLKYALSPNETLHGSLSISSKQLLIDELMPETEEETTEEVVETDTTATDYSYAAIEVPKDIDFVMDANLAKIVYDGLTLNNAKGKIIVRDGVLTMDNLSTSTLGGSIVFNGTYNTQELRKPTFDMKLGVKSISIQESFNSFNTVQQLAPVAKNVAGDVSTEFALSGLIDSTMMPVYNTLNGGGLLNVKEAALSGKLAEGITKFTSKGGKNSLALQDIAMNVHIEDGKVNVDPFDVTIDGHKSTVAGSTSLDGSLDYTVKTSIPAGQVGEQVNAALNKFTGSKKEPSSEIKVNLGITGKYDSPKVSLLGSDSKDAVKEQVTKAAVDKAQELIKDKISEDIPVTKDEAVAKAQEEADKILADAQKKADQVKKEAKNTADQIRAESKVQAEKLIKDAGSNPFKKEAAKVAAKKLTDEGEKKATTVEKEGQKQADNIMAKAQEQSDAVLKKTGSK